MLPIQIGYIEIELYASTYLCFPYFMCVSTKSTLLFRNRNNSLVRNIRASNFKFTCFQFRDDSCWDSNNLLVRNIRASYIYRIFFLGLDSLRHITMLLSFPFCYCHFSYHCSLNISLVQLVMFQAAKLLRGTSYVELA
jgi:hypothetical protein